MDIKEEHNEFFHELDGRGFIFQNKKWLGGCFEDDQLQVVWEMWSSGRAAKAQAVPEGFVLVNAESLALHAKSIRMFNNSEEEEDYYEIENHVCAIEAMIEAQEPTND